MAADKITWDDKVGVTPYETRINQVQDLDMNEIKLKFNNNADLLDDTITEVDINTLDILDLQNNASLKDTIVFKSANYTAIVGNYIMCDSSGGVFTITLPTAIGLEGRQINITKTDSSTNNIIVDTTLSQTIIGNLTETITKQYTNATFISDGANWFIK